ncbi:MAG TPA: hypothetical protein VLJ58_08225, partial [Ramlibacter sp.]|nr:hypothetical protein [Ramlibacter sp.]
TLVRAGLAGLLLTAACAFAQSAPPAGAGGKPPGPPPEAVAACSGKSAGATVSFSGRRGETVSGTCELFGQTLAARPAGGPPPPPAK